jgi:Thioredoxin reductase
MGPDLMQIFKKQAERFGTQIKTETINKIEKIDGGLS